MPTTNVSPVPRAGPTARYFKCKHLKWPRNFSFPLSSVHNSHRPLPLKFKPYRRKAHQPSNSNSNTMSGAQSKIHKIDRRKHLRIASLHLQGRSCGTIEVYTGNMDEAITYMDMLSWDPVVPHGIRRTWTWTSHHWRPPLRRPS